MRLAEYDKALSDLGITDVEVAEILGLNHATMVAGSSFQSGRTQERFLSFYRFFKAYYEGRHPCSPRSVRDVIPDQVVQPDAQPNKKIKFGLDD